MEALIMFAVNVLTSVLKKWVVPRWGKAGVQGIAFALSLIGAIYYLYADSFPAIRDVVLAAVAIFSVAVAFYEVVLSRISIFTSEEKVVS